jgi:hypothetical protein
MVIWVRLKKALWHVSWGHGNGDAWQTATIPLGATQAAGSATASSLYATFRLTSRLFHDTKSQVRDSGYGMNSHVGTPHYTQCLREPPATLAGDRYTGFNISGGDSGITLGTISL